MTGAGKHCCRLLLLSAALMVAAAIAAPLAEQASRKNAGQAVRNKAVHFIESRPAKDRQQGAQKEVVLPEPTPQVQPDSEPQPLELKGVRG